MCKPAKVVAILTARPGKAGELRALLESLIEPSRAEPGALRYDLWTDRNDPDRYVLDELYTDTKAVAAHRATRHFQNYLARISELAERTAFALDPIVVAPAMDARRSAAHS